jgi:hypothetical protein
MTTKDTFDGKLKALFEERRRRGLLLLLLL